jgi:hypothetical protein
VQAAGSGAVPAAGGRSAGELAAGAFFAVGAGDREVAVRSIRWLHGTGALTWAMGRWADTLIDIARSRGGPVPGSPAQPSPGEDGRAPALAGGPRAAGRWAGRFLAARARGDLRACGALIAAIPPGRAPQHALSLLELVSDRLRELRPGWDEEGRRPGGASWKYPARVGDVMRGEPLSEADRIMFGRRVAAWQALHGLRSGELALWLGMSGFRLSRIKNSLLTKVTRDEAVYIAGRLGMHASGTGVECTAYSAGMARLARELSAAQADIEAM